MPEEEPNGEIRETVQINSKHDVFKIPVSATIVSEAEFAELNKEQLQKTGKGIQNSKVREKLMRKIAEANDGPQ